MRPLLLSNAITLTLHKKCRVCLYSLYGLNVGSDVALPGLPPGGDGSDVAICERRFDLPSVFSEEIGKELDVTQDSAYLRCDFGSFHLHAGREISMMPAPAADASFLAQFVAGIVFGILLRQRGDLVLHASAIAVHEKVVAFVGNTVSGKSTLVAALLGRGHAFVADDVLPVRFADGVPLAYPGVPTLKLWPEIVRSMGDDPAGLPLAWPAEEKRLWRVERGFVRDPLPLSRVYVLALGDAHTVTAVSPTEAVYELARCGYCAEFLQGIDAEWQFHQTSALAQSVPIYRLRRVMSLDRLPELVDLIEADLSGPATQADAGSGG